MKSRKTNDVSASIGVIDATTIAGQAKSFILREGTIDHDQLTIIVDAAAIAVLIAASSEETEKTIGTSRNKF